MFTWFELDGMSGGFVPDVSKLKKERNKYVVNIKVVQNIKWNIHIGRRLRFH